MKSGAWAIVGYGNPQRRDDGLGPYVVAQMRQTLGETDRVRFFDHQQLVPELVEDLSEIDLVILVDATVDCLDAGWHRKQIVPDCFQAPPLMTHSVSPGFLLGLLGLLYRRYPPAWLVSIQGDDFGFGEGLSTAAKTRAHRVVSDLIALVTKET
ncbi:MAG: hydrogenase maturation protease [Deltaproteobacteria bacterium]|nr:hydrogenase maturation protease [Deltaproteobacteria bacterium]